MAVIYHGNLKEVLPKKYEKVLEALSFRRSVLEIGCNTGYFSQALVDRGYDVLGIEKDEESAKIARSKGISVISGDVENDITLSSVNQKFEAVLLMDILEHLRDPAKALNSLKTVLSEKGIVIITVPNIAYWAIRKDLLLGRWNYADAGILDRTHIHFYTAASFKSLVESAGYRIQAFKPAEGMIPLEHIFREIPILRPLISSIRNMALRLMPGVFTVTYLIEAVPG